MWLVLILLKFCVTSNTAQDLSLAPLIREQGYPFEEHEVVTEDGYVLTLHRIPYGKSSPGKIGRPVILQHGIIANSASWVLTSPDKSLGFIVVEEGYDLWMPNNRGNAYSMKHVTLDPNKSSDVEKFWDFSFHELGYYDMPAIIDYVLNKTQQKDLYYIGHSQGTSQFFAMMSLRPEYNEKVVHMSALAPIAFMGNTRGTLKVLTYIGSIIQPISKLFHVYNISGNSPYLRAFNKMLCNSDAITVSLCDNLLFLITGFDAKQFNESLIPMILKYESDGAAIKQFVHFYQLTNNGMKFRQFDYGEKQNLISYGQKEPPEYNLSKTKVPVMLHYANNDWLSGIPDVMKLKSRLPNSESRLVPYKDFNHIDFIWAIDACKLLYNDIINTMNKY